jgi:hypothetical protein
MADPMMIAIAAAVAGKLTESLTTGAKAAMANLVRLVRARVAGDDAARSALADAERAPGDDARIAALATQLERLAGADPEFAGQLRHHWSQTNAHLHAHHGGVVNEVSGSVSGHVVQARDIEGGIKFGPTA